MLKKTNYKPFNKKTNFTSTVAGGMIEELENDKFKYRLKIKRSGHVPKTGIFVAEKLSKYNFKNMKVLDIGTGESGILAIHSVAMGAKEVIGLDINKSIIKQARLNAGLNNFNDRVRFKLVGIENYRPNYKFDIIISNPPQMPTRKLESLHDDGGSDGRLYINYIMRFASEYLKEGGPLFFTAFDFLGVNKSYNKSLSIQDYSEKLNLKLSIVGKQKKTVECGSYTKKNLSWICKKYPRYSFLKGKDCSLGYYVYLIRGQKL